MKCSWSSDPFILDWKVHSSQIISILSIYITCLYCTLAKKRKVNNNCFLCVLLYLFNLFEVIVRLFFNLFICSLNMWLCFYQKVFFLARKKIRTPTIKRKVFVKYTKLRHDTNDLQCFSLSRFNENENNMGENAHTENLLGSFHFHVCCAQHLSSLLSSIFFFFLCFVSFFFVGWTLSLSKTKDAINQFKLLRCQEWCK